MYQILIKKQKIHPAGVTNAFLMKVYMVFFGTKWIFFDIILIMIKLCTMRYNYFYDVEKTNCPKSKRVLFTAYSIVMVLVWIVSGELSTDNGYNEWL